MHYRSRFINFHGLQLENELDASYFDPPMDNDEEDGESMYAPSKWNPPLGDDDE